MWKSLLTFAVAVLLATPAFAQDDRMWQVDGKWTGRTSRGTITFEFKAERFQLIGTATVGDTQLFEISDGSFVADQVSFLATRSGATLRYVGFVKGNILILNRDPRAAVPFEVLPRSIFLGRAQ